MRSLSWTFVFSCKLSPLAVSFGQTATEPSCMRSRLQAASQGIMITKPQLHHKAAPRDEHWFRTAATGSPGLFSLKALSQPTGQQSSAGSLTSHWHLKSLGNHTNPVQLRQTTVIWRMCGHHDSPDRTGIVILNNSSSNGESYAPPPPLQLHGALHSPAQNQLT